ncbi:MAG: universal stress protein [Bacteroidales bacterium]|jgi:nucleotide-binding universal stress UspA family protein
MKKILVPVDFSGHTDIACTYALEIAGKGGAEIRLFHTYSDQFIIADSSFPDAIDMSTMYNEELLKEVFHQSEKKMEMLQAHLEEKIQKSNRKDIELKVTLVGGEIESELHDLCKDFQPDIVVMGTRGTGKTSNMWGRVSTHIINHSKIPVLTVPNIKKFRGFQQIMFAADLSGKDEELIRKIFSIFSEFPFHLSCIHFLIKEDESEENKKMATLRKTFEREEKSGKISFKILEVTDDKQTVINQFIESQSIDLIAFQPHKHNLFYNLFTRQITKKNLQATNVPLLALPIC